METTTITGRICFTEQPLSDYVRIPQNDYLNLRPTAAWPRLVTPRLELAELVTIEYPEDGLCEPAD